MNPHNFKWNDGKAVATRYLLSLTNTELWIVALLTKKTGSVSGRLTKDSNILLQVIEQVSARKYASVDHVMVAGGHHTLALVKAGWLRFSFNGPDETFGNFWLTHEAKKVIHRATGVDVDSFS